MEPCYYCGKRAGNTRDHTVPKSQGGGHTVPACGDCNSSKGRLSVEEFRAVLAVRAGILPDLPKILKFWCELQPIVCIHGRFATEMCVKCGRWLGHPCRKEPEMKLKYKPIGRGKEV